VLERSAKDGARMALRGRRSSSPGLGGRSSLDSGARLLDERLVHGASGERLAQSLLGDPGIDAEAVGVAVRSRPCREQV